MKVPLNEYLIQDEARIPGFDLIDTLFNIVNIMESNDLETNARGAETASETTDQNMNVLTSEKLRGVLSVEQLKKLLTDIKVSALVIPDEYIVSVWTMILLDITTVDAVSCAEIARTLLRDAGDVKVITLYLFEEFIKSKKGT